MDIEFKTLIGDGLMHALRTEDERAKRRGDDYFLARQQEYFVQARSDCWCKQNACGGCAALGSVLHELEKALAPLAAKEDGGKYDRETNKARGIWGIQKRQRAEQMTRIQDVVRGQSHREYPRGGSDE